MTNNSYPYKRNRIIKILLLVGIVLISFYLLQEWIISNSYTSVKSYPVGVIQIEDVEIKYSIKHECCYPLDCFDSYEEWYEKQGNKRCDCLYSVWCNPKEWVTKLPLGRVI